MSFFAFEKRWLLSLFAGLIPSGVNSTLPEGADQMPMHGMLDDLIAHAPLKFLLGLRAATWVLTWMAPFTIGRFASFSKLSPLEQMKSLEKLQASPVYVLRELPLLLKTIGCLGYCGLPQVKARLAIEPRDSSPPEWVPRDP